MRPSRVTILVATHVLVGVVGAALALLAARATLKSSLSSGVAIGYSAESVHLALSSGQLGDAERVAREHLKLLDELRQDLDPFTFAAERMRVLAGLGARYEAEGRPTDAQRIFGEALASCRLAKMSRCTIEDAKALGERSRR